VSILTRLKALMRRSVSALIVAGRRSVPAIGKADVVPADVDLRAAQALAQMEFIAESRPIQVSVETTTLCNSRCTFCAYPKVVRPKTVMTLDLFEKICRDFEALGGGLLGLAPMMSDPLVDPYLLDRVRLVVGSFPKIKLHMFTNLIALARFSDDEVRFMLQSMRHIDVSIGGLEADGYAEMFGVNKFDSVYASLLRLGKFNQSMGSKCRLNLHVRTNKVTATQQSPIMSELLDLGYICVGIATQFSDFGGIVRQEDVPDGITVVKVDRTGETDSCLIAMSYIGIAPDGQVAGCQCFDGRGATTIGNACEDSLADIWASQRAKDFRYSFKNNATPDFCKSCAFYLPHSKTFRDQKLLDFDVSKDCFWEKLN